MFALALFDKEKKIVLLARDHAGIKPLYYSIENGSLYFASEIRAFKKLRPNWSENEEWKKYFLLFGHLPEPITTLQNVKPIPKGNVLEFELPSLQIQSHCFYQPNYQYTIFDEKEAIQKVHSALIASVQRHLISDAPIGLFLSGGIDSSLLTLIAEPFLENNLHTLSIVFDDEKFSEKKYQDIIIQKTGAQHRSFVVSKNEFISALPDILDAMDQPSNDGINSYFISKYAKEYGLKAVLSGIGADELLGGYPSFYRNEQIAITRILPAFIFAAAKLFPDDRRKKINFLQLKNAMGDYLFNRGFFIPAQIAELLDCTEKEIWLLLEELALPPFVNELLPQEQVSYTEANLYMQNQLLKDTDYMSMWHSVEVRVPFLDKELMDALYSIHPAIRYNETQKKHLLIKAFEQELPKAIWDRPKQGFTFPFEQWMKNIELFEKKQDNKLLYKFERKNLHWSRYWTYLLAQKSNSKYNGWQ
jgi:asparagine synthase (glutamine-hydrolysing)